MPIEPDIMVKGFLPQDIIVMCSDGLTNMLSEKEIYETIMNNIDTAAEELVKKANSHGGYDNISVIIIKNDQEKRESETEIEDENL